MHVCKHIGDTVTVTVDDLSDLHRTDWKCREREKNYGGQAPVQKEYKKNDDSKNSAEKFSACTVLFNCVCC